MQKPSPGRVIMAVGGSAASNGADVAPALITRVWPNENAADGTWLINATVFPDYGDPVFATSTKLYDTEEQARANLPYPSSIAAYWPPRI